MRIIKTLGYALLGYTLYQLVSQITLTRAPISSRKRLSPQKSGAQNITGGGEGLDVETRDSDGGVTHHRVGRGVKH